ncbi:PEP-CTERM sorting domain-containing protein [Roseimaritima ulvae]|uniref:PEP-CTERM motif protein n=1 Tax=Roseimaritima ulvae TaxID=980254 RepID=A0A5B9QPT9_9BACT|nr:PEP-CTERM sorting domain-containing protein [Roseimaritima ulvae]QEG40974.1 PEP-CTERM motif protein [Roseimaritima ulvae]
MMRAIQLAVTCVAGLLATAEQVQAGLITITDYSISDAARSGFGDWSHLYGGSIVETGNFTISVSALSYPFTRADYSGGSGTLNDGLEGADRFSTQLFANNTDANPIITLNLNGFFNISDITLLTFDSSNTIPGRISAFDVTIGANTVNFATSEPTTDDEFVSLIGSPLDGIPTNQIILSNFSHDGGNSLVEMFAIGEIRVQGSEVNAVPEPTSLALFGIGTCVAGLGASRRRRHEKQQQAMA